MIVLGLAGLIVGTTFALHRGGEPLSRSELNRMAAAASAAGASDAAARAAAAPKPVIFLGDSYTAGTGASDPSRRWATLVATAQNWTIENRAFGSTGYVTSTSGSTAQAGCAADSCPNYDQALATTTTAEPAVVVVSGGRNDLNSVDTRFGDAVKKFYADVRAKFPSAKIVATSPIWDDDPAPARLGQIADAVKAGVEAVGGTYLDIGEPLAGHPEDVTADGIHPSDAGHQAIADALNAALKSAGVRG